MNKMINNYLSKNTFLVITAMFFLVFIKTSYAHTLSVVKTGIHDYILYGHITSSELVRKNDTITRERGVSVIYNTPFWARAVSKTGLASDCPDNKESAAEIINSALGRVILTEGALYNYNNSNVVIDCRIEGGNKGSWSFEKTIKVPERDNVNAGCRVTTPNVMDFGTVRQGSNKIISTGIFIICDKNAYVKLSFQVSGESVTPGILIIGDTIIKYGFSYDMSQSSSLRIKEGESMRQEFSLEVVNTGSTFGRKEGYILMIADIS